MESVITRVVINEGAQAEWEATMRDRMTAAESSPGWIGGSILAPEGDRGVRVILGLWESRATGSTGMRIQRSATRPSASTISKAMPERRLGTRSSTAAAGSTSNA